MNQETTFTEGLYSLIWILENPSTTDWLFGFNKSRFYGGWGSVRTLHENMFAKLYPGLRKQVSFGTGKGGASKYNGIRRITVDFYDQDNKIAYEIDGKSHKTRLNQLKDMYRDYILFKEYGIRVYRFTNAQVEQMMKDRLLELKSNGAFDKYKGGHKNG